MELKNYFLLLKRYKYLLIIVPVVVVVAAKFLVHFLPDSYVSKAQIITGVVDQSQHVMNNDEPRDQQAESKFTNLIETIQLDKVMNQVSYDLTLHDLTAFKPFRNGRQLTALSAQTKSRMAAVLLKKQEGFELLNPSIPAEHDIDSLITGLEYNPDKLLKKNLKIYHSDGSDFINIEGDSENPELSAFIVNHLSDAFIRYYTAYLNRGHNKSAAFLKDLLTQKEAVMRGKIAELQDYKVKHGILDIGDESKDVYGQINDLETHREQEQKDVIAYQGAIKSIDSRFDPKDRRYLEATTSKVNSAILNTREQLHQLNDKYVDQNFNPRIKKSIDSLQNVLNGEIAESADKYISNPLAAKDNIVQEKLKMENNLELARYGVSSLDKQLGDLKGRINGLVPAQAVVKSLERDVDISTKEYLDVQDKYNQASVNNVLPVQLSQLHAALPGVKQPTKKLLLVVLSGAVSFVFCLVVLLVVFYFDESVHNAADLKRLTDLPVLGQLNYVPGLQSKSKKLGTSLQMFKEMLRDIRFEIDSATTDGKILAITSLEAGQGKTLFSFSLAYAYAIAKQKVLLIDGNFASPIISETAKSNLFLEDYFRSKDMPLPDDTYLMDHILDSAKEPRLLEIENATTGNRAVTVHRVSDPLLEDEPKALISVMGNRGGDTSLFELSTRQSIRERMDWLKTQFDVIIIETGSLDKLGTSKEWLTFADNTIAVFENNQTIASESRRSIRQLHMLNGKMLGWVLNKVTIKDIRAVSA